MTNLIHADIMLHVWGNGSWMTDTTVDAMDNAGTPVHTNHADLLFIPASVPPEDYDRIVDAFCKRHFTVRANDDELNYQQSYPAGIAPPLVPDLPRRLRALRQAYAARPCSMSHELEPC